MLPAFFFLFPTVKHIIYTALLTAAAAFPHTLQAKNGDLLPKPQQMAIGPEAAFKLNRAVTLTDPTQCAYLANVLRQNGCTLRNRAKAKVVVKLVDHIEGAFDHAVALFRLTGCTSRLTGFASRLSRLRALSGQRKPCNSWPRATNQAPKLSLIHI